MQYSNEKTLHLAKTLGDIVKDLRLKVSDSTLDKLAISYGISKGTLSTLENGKAYCKLITIWLISEAIGIKCSEVIKMLEDNLGSDFKLIDE